MACFLDCVLDEMKDAPPSLKVWDWVRSQMNIPKFRSRAYYATKNPNVPVKVVLMEYSSSYRSGETVINFYVPGTGLNTRCLQYDRRILDYLHYQIADCDPDILVYSRRKIVNDQPHPFLRQLVVKFNLQHVQPPLPKDLPGYVEPLDSEDEL